jgi:CheY-like chemotaxis protein
MQDSIGPVAQGGDSPVVMIVDHEILVRMAIAAYLRDCGLKVLEAANAAEAVTVLDAATPVDVAVVEVQLPGEMDGFTLARWIRSRHADLHVILASSTARKVEAAGELCDEGPMLERPYQTTELERRIRTLLGSGRRVRKPERDARSAPAVM